LAQGSTDRPEPEQAQLSLPLEARGEGSQHTLDRRYLATLNAPLPALDGKTPKQAARSKAGREKVARWLKCLENETARRSKADARPGYNFGWMWEALKIKDLRQ
jgi:hypothetical protein